MQDIEDKERYINTGRLIHILSNQMKRRNASEAVGDDGLTTMQKHVLKHILLETMHREVYQKDIEEEFRIRKSTATGILQLMEKKLAPLPLLISSLSMIESALTGNQ